MQLPASAPEVSENGEHAPVVLGRLSDSELCEGASDMRLDRFLALAPQQFSECGQVADRAEVRVVSRHPSAVLPHLDRSTKVVNSFRSSAREALVTGDVVVEVWLVGTCLDQLHALGRRLRVLAGLVQRLSEIPPQLRREGGARGLDLDS
jgi:hypothetical protein